MKKFLTVSIIMFSVIIAFCNVKALAINDPKWDLHFENIEITSGSVNATQEPTIMGDSNSEIAYSVNLSTPGDFFEFTVDVVNAGTMDAMVSDANYYKLTAELEKYLSYTATYADGTEIKKNDLLKAGSTDKLRIRLEFKRDINAEDLPNEETNILFSLNACYVQADPDATERENSGTTDSNTDSGNKSEDDNSNKENRSLLDVIKNPKTGDLIIGYAFVFILAVITLIIAKKKSKKEEK